MKYVEVMKRFLLLALLLSIVDSGPTASLDRSVNGGNSLFETPSSTGSSIPEIYEMNVATNVTNRYAKTLITSKVRNSKSEAHEAVFFVILPEKAFISEFVMKIGDETYNAYVKEKEEAKNIYDKAVSKGQSASHIGVSARNSNKFTVSLNIEAKGEAVFQLTYEELLQRQKGKYDIILNINPGQIVPKLDVQVTITESSPIAFVRTPSVRSGNEIPENDEDLVPNAEISTINYSKTSIVKFHPDEAEQRRLAKELDTENGEGFNAQFVVEYDVVRNVKGGEVLLNDGYFVHFLAPEHLDVLPTQVVFVLDISGSMRGTKIQQLVDAMVNILNDLKPNDSFSIVAFNDIVHVWNIYTLDFMDLSEIGNDADYGNLDNLLRDEGLPEPIAATRENIAAAKAFVRTIRPRSLTNIIGGLEVGLFIVKKEQETISEFRQPLMIFLTDGGANVGIYNGDRIINTVTKLNPKEKRIPIFSLSFGNEADKSFLRKLSSQNFGFSRHIYEAGDASLQLQDFYQQVSSPSLKDITFKYTQNATETTIDRFPIFFCGTEMVVAGKISTDRGMVYTAEGWRPSGSIHLRPRVIKSTGPLERMWAFLTLRQILESRELFDNKTEITKKAVDLALKYSFVTPVTSMVVVKPDDTSSEVDTENAYSESAKAYGSSTPVNSNRISTPSTIYSDEYWRSHPDRGTSNYQQTGFHGNLDYANAVPSDGSMKLLKLEVPSGYGQQIHSPFEERVPLGPYYYHPWTTTEPVVTELPAPLPELQHQKWFKSIMIDNSTINVFRNYKLASYGTVVVGHACPRTISNKVGTCTLIHQCRNDIPMLTNLPIFARLLCDLQGYAGICCDSLVQNK